MDIGSVYHYRLDWIASFVAVARHGGFSAAAKALYRSQPRISSHVAELERRLGARLLDRSTQPPVLTPEGRGLLPHAEEILQRLGMLADLIDGSVRGEVRLGIYPSAASHLYPLAVRRLGWTHPQVRLVVREGPSLALGDQLTVGEIDLAVRPLHPLINSEAVASHVLWREPLVAVVRRDHRMAKAASVRLAQIAMQPVISIGEVNDGHSQQYETNLAFANLGLNPTFVARTNQPQTLISLVRHGMGVGVTNSLAMTTANTDGVALVPIDDPHCERVVAVWWRPSDVASPAVEAVRATLEQLPSPHWTRSDTARGEAYGTPSRGRTATGSAEVPGEETPSGCNSRRDGRAAEARLAGAAARAATGATTRATTSRRRGGR